MGERNNSRPAGVGFFGLLTIMFIGLRLAGHISWSWWWVLSPLWLPVLGMALILAIALIIESAS